ncbi:hypothetical protein LCGC14_3088410 [marine sediment metagenome]|uniref:Transketolase-like pyrimidine-binding domain-containing protein n=1 Tax=marine sediment metagenome TaxID=412755 RepID=A0A0F8WBV7_9ZZZZ
MKSQRDSFFDALYELNDDRVWVISADCGAPALDRWRKTDRFINVGIAEQNMVNIAIGLALSGKRPYCYAITPFLTGRAFDQIRQACMMNLPITFVGIGAGYSYDDSGPTHHGIDDIGIMRVLPNMRILQANDSSEAELLATIRYPEPAYIRLDRGSDKKYLPHYKIGDRCHYPIDLWPCEFPTGITEVVEEHLVGGLGSIITEQESQVKRRYIKEYLYAYGRDNLRKQAKL